MLKQNHYKTQNIEMSRKKFNFFEKISVAISITYKFKEK